VISLAQRRKTKAYQGQSQVHYPVSVVPVLIPLLLVIYLYNYPLLLESIFLFTSFIKSSVDIGF
jgi:hypothetical protein